VRILIVDACRDNDAVQQVTARLPSTRAAAFSRGSPRSQSADGKLVVFATQANRVAADGTGRNTRSPASFSNTCQRWDWSCAP
jgi:hypothetical protein